MTKWVIIKEYIENGVNKKLMGPYIYGDTEEVALKEMNRRGLSDYKIHGKFVAEINGPNRLK